MKYTLLRTSFKKNILFFFVFFVYLNNIFVLIGRTGANTWQEIIQSALVKKKLVATCATCAGAGSIMFLNIDNNKDKQNVSRDTSSPLDQSMSSSENSDDSSRKIEVISSVQKAIITSKGSENNKKVYLSTRPTQLNQKQKQPSQEQKQQKQLNSQKSLSCADKNDSDQNISSQLLQKQPVQQKKQRSPLATEKNYQKSLNKQNISKPSTQFIKSSLKKELVLVGGKQDSKDKLNLEVSFGDSSTSVDKPTNFEELQDTSLLLFVAVHAAAAQGQQLSFNCQKALIDTEYAKILRDMEAKDAIISLTSENEQSKPFQECCFADSSILSYLDFLNLSVAKENRRGSDNARCLDKADFFFKSSCSAGVQQDLSYREVVTPFFEKEIIKYLPTDDDKNKKDDEQRLRRLIGCLIALLVNNKKNLISGNTYNRFLSENLTDKGKSQDDFFLFLKSLDLSAMINAINDGYKKISDKSQDVSGYYIQRIMDKHFSGNIAHIRSDNKYYTTLCRLFESHGQALFSTYDETFAANYRNYKTKDEFLAFMYCINLLINNIAAKSPNTLEKVFMAKLRSVDTKEAINSAGGLNQFLQQYNFSQFLCKENSNYYALFNIALLRAMKKNSLSKIIKLDNN